MAPETKSNFEPHIGRSVSLDHAAELLGVSRRTIYNRIRENRLRTVRTAGGSQRVLVESLGGHPGATIDANATPKRG
jgi:excisionase family DNA binding protein